MEDRSKPALEALLRVRTDGVERASVEVQKAEGVVARAAAVAAAARAELDAHLAERAAFQAEDLGAAVRPDALASRGAYLAVIDGRIAQARGLAATREREHAAAEKACEAKRRALLDETAQERALRARVEHMNREGERRAEKARDDDALENHVARRT